MPISWESSVKASKKLTVFNGISGGSWATVFAASLESFKKLNARYGLGVKLSAIKDEGAANVIVKISDGALSFEHGDETYSEPFSGTGLKGRTFLVHPNGEITKAHTFLPSQPLINTPSGQRGLGKEAMKVILVHELIHACGLKNSDHSDADFFYKNPVPFPGNTPNGDKIMLITKTGNIKFPKLFLSPATVSAVQSVWKS